MPLLPVADLKHISLAFQKQRSRKWQQYDLSRPEILSIIQTIDQALDGMTTSFLSTARQGLAQDRRSNLTRKMMIELVTLVVQARLDLE